MNQFIEAHNQRIKTVQYMLQQFRLKGSPDIKDIPINDILFIINGLQNEIHSLQYDLDIAKKDLIKKTEDEIKL